MYHSTHQLRVSLMCVMQGSQKGVFSLCPVPHILSYLTWISLLFGNQCIQILLPTDPPQVHYYILLSGNPASESLWEICKAEVPSPVLGGPFVQIMPLGYPFLLSISSTVFSEEILFSLTSFFSSSFSFFSSPPPKRGPCTHRTSVFPLSYMPCLNLLFIISRTMIHPFSIDFLIYICITEK